MSDEKKNGHRSFLMKSDSKSDYKVEPSKVLDVVAAVVSLLAAFAVWLLSSPI